jgi:hypothetical protein
MSRFTTLGLSILLAFAPAAMAVDGTVLINQSTITNGLTGCPTGGHFPIIICQSGSYRLSGNVTLPDAVTDAIDITADNVTIDLNGFTILGPTVCSGSPLICNLDNSRGTGNGIFSSNANIVVMNGQIKGMGNGISLLGPRSRVQNVQATSNANNGILVADNSLVASCTVSSNGGTGIVASGPSVVTGNVVSSNLVGIRNNFSTAAMMISGNSVVSNKVGVELTCPSLILGNLVSLNGNNSQLIDSGGNLVGTGNLGAFGSLSGCVLANNAP